MKSEIEDYPLSLFTTAFTSVAGRILAVILTWIIGTFLGTLTQGDLYFIGAFAFLRILLLPAVLLLGVGDASGYLAGGLAFALSLWLAFGSALRIEAFFLSLLAVFLFITYALATTYDFTLREWQRFAGLGTALLLIMIASRFVVETMKNWNVRKRQPPCTRSPERQGEP
jgi:hypothetical protein